MIKLIYFSWAGRAGPIRDCLRLGQVPFEDLRLSREAFLAMKSARALPFDLLPVLELEDGSRIAQSNTILRWAAQQAGLTPPSELARLQVESLLDLVEDYAARLSVTIREPDLSVRAHQRSALAERWMPELYSHLTRQLEQSDSKWLVGEQLTAADLKAYHLLVKLTDGSLDGMPPNALDTSPTLQRWLHCVHEARICQAPS